MLDDRRFERTRFSYDHQDTMMRSVHLEDVCGRDVQETKAHLLLPFLKKILQMQDYQEPDYEQLGFLLQKVLIENDKMPKQKFDFYEHELEIWYKSQLPVQLQNTLSLNFGKNDVDDISETSMDSAEFEDVGEIYKSKNQINELSQEFKMDS